MKQYYLQCLHQLVNARSHDSSRDIPSESQDQVYKLRPLSRDKSHDAKKREKSKDGNKTCGVELESHEPISRSHDPYRTQKQSQEDTIGPGPIPNSQHTHTPQAFQVSSSHHPSHHHREDLIKKSASSSTQSSQTQTHQLVSSHHGHGALKQKASTKQQSNIHVHVTPGGGHLVQTSPGHRQCVACTTDGKGSRKRAEVDVGQVKRRKPQGDARRGSVTRGAGDVIAREGEKRTRPSSEHGRGSKRNLFGMTSSSKKSLQSRVRAREHSVHSS